MEPTMAETFEAWTTGAVTILTGVAILIGGGWVLWRYIIPGPFAPTWEIEVRDCEARRLQSGRFVYTAEINMTNTSVTSYIVDSVSLGIFLEDEDVSDEALERLPITELSELGRVFSPRSEKWAVPRAVRDEPLRHIVVVRGLIRFQRRRYLGTFGWRSEKLKVQKHTPVDAESLALYAESGKEEANDD